MFRGIASIMGNEMETNVETEMETSIVGLKFTVGLFRAQP